jgi:L,D-transpeptidase catalytic domain/Putative peptidoglycan binding domain
MRPRKSAVIGAVLMCALISFPTGVRAQTDPESVTLKGDRTRVKFGRAVKLSGAISPASGGQTVVITNDDGHRVAEATTGPAGGYHVKFKPRRNTTLTATWSTATSDPVAVKVRPVAVVKLRAVRMFDDAVVRGSVRPALFGQKVKVELRRFGKVVASKRVRLKGGRWFNTRLYVSRPGKHLARVVVTSPKHLREADRSARLSASMPHPVGPGARSDVVKLLERRLRDLGYYIPSADRYFDHRTSDALIAFHKVQGMARVGSASTSTWRVLANPTRPRPRHRNPKFHVEIDQTRQVILVVRNRKVRHILHTSTGAGGATRDGTWTVHRKLAGTSGGGLYYPSYFDGLRAIHGWREVPTYPASHGCARVPMWAAQWIFGKVPLGTRVYVYH